MYVDNDDDSTHNSVAVGANTYGERRVSTNTVDCQEVYVAAPIYGESVGSKKPDPADTIPAFISEGIYFNSIALHVNTSSSYTCRCL